MKIRPWLIYAGLIAAFAVIFIVLDTTTEYFGLPFTPSIIVASIALAWFITHRITKGNISE